MPGAAQGSWKHTSTHSMTVLRWRCTAWVSTDTTLMSVFRATWLPGTQRTEQECHFQGPFWEGKRTSATTRPLTGSLDSRANKEARMEQEGRALVGVVVYRMLLSRLVRNLPRMLMAKTLKPRCSPLRRLCSRIRKGWSSLCSCWPLCWWPPAPPKHMLLLASSGPAQERPARCTPTDKGRGMKDPSGACCCRRKEVQRLEQGAYLRQGCRS